MALVKGLQKILIWIRRGSAISYVEEEKVHKFAQKAKRQSQIKKNTLINPHGSGRPSATNASDSNTTRVSVLQYDKNYFHFFKS